MLGNGFPHTIEIWREKNETPTPPYSSTSSSDIWSGDCCSQIGGTYDKQYVSESTHTVFFELIPEQLLQGDRVKIILKDEWVAIYGYIVQAESVEIFEDDGKVYGTTVWVRQTKN